MAINKLNKKIIILLALIAVIFISVLIKTKVKEANKNFAQPTVNNLQEQSIVSEDRNEPEVTSSSSNDFNKTQELDETNSLNEKKEVSSDETSVTEKTVNRELFPADNTPYKLLAKIGTTISSQPLIYEIQLIKDNLILDRITAESRTGVLIKDDTYALTVTYSTAEKGYIITKASAKVIYD